ncbi:MAG: class I SAM-dependent methyltransferase, partial [Chitinophagales bacterium]
MDELPLWSAPFGLKLLETIRMNAHSKMLDIGFGFGFPLLEAVMRIGEHAKAFGIDPWELAIEWTNEKIKYYGLKNVEVVKGGAGDLPYATDFFDLIMLNNSINNVSVIPATLAECYRVAKPGAQFVFTMNLDTSMKEFYKVFRKVLKEKGLHEAIEQLNAHIYEKRKQVKYMKKRMKKSGFT